MCQSQLREAFLYSWSTTTRWVDCESFLHRRIGFDVYIVVMDCWQLNVLFLLCTMVCVLFSDLKQEERWRRILGMTEASTTTSKARYIAFMSLCFLLYATMSVLRPYIRWEQRKLNLLMFRIWTICLIRYVCTGDAEHCSRHCGFRCEEYNLACRVQATLLCLFCLVITWNHSLQIEWALDLLGRKA